MRKLINVFFVAAGLVFTANVANAQQKFGHLNSDEIFASLPEAKTVSATVENLAKTKQAEIDKMIAEYQTKYKAAEDKQKTLSEANKDVVGKELQAAGQEIQDLGKRIEDARTKATKDVTDKQNELFPPLQQKVGNAIAAVAKEKGLAYVFDTSISQGFNSLVYSDGGEDITAAVKAKLGATATAAPAATKPAGAKPKQ
ncbi:OmpH family outer membrane protein [Pedobacter sp. KR3-3]|uniref:OmpH family outer membrane protein n=1 Tax=Pedobacter albus TaxID=3113905 RepID=A0ABU7I7M2_9SPHI|nr:OmpH family outer membrane protein [Pedobacter sp. KR3-3]MEE1945455.1 OmpH family outer membrane protein [Pedobacter sp. KR3-3]